MKKSIIRMKTVIFLLSLFTQLGSQARMLPGDHVILRMSSVNYNVEKKSISLVADQILISMMSSYVDGKDAAPPPPSPYAATPSVTPMSSTNFTSSAL
ncbi:hypothetical protein AgCh_006369 [Apium graveolens]